MDKANLKNSKTVEEKLEELKKEFIKTIPQLEDIQEIQKTHRGIQREKVEEQYPFINTQTSSTI
jgi:hypothetical protein